MKQLNFVGIDVSAHELVIKVQKDGEMSDDVSIFENTLAGIKKLHSFITKRGRSARVCMEATGVYHFQLAVYLSNAKNVEVMVVNPRATKHFASAAMSRAKTDKVDAELILRYLIAMPFKSWKAPDSKRLKVQAISRRILQLKAMITAEKNRLHTGEFNEAMNITINESIDSIIKYMKKSVDELEKEALKIITTEPELSDKLELLTSITGIADTSAIQILAELICLPADMLPEQWVAHAGLDPRPFESGSSINKPRRISKTGNKYLRTALYMPAWVAVQHEPHVKAFYNKLIAAGKKPLQAIVAVMRKLLHAIWGIFKSNTKWDGKKFYEIPESI